MKLKTKFTLLFVSIYTFLFLAASIVIYEVHSNYRRQEFFGVLKERALTITELITDLGPTNKELLDLVKDLSANQVFDVHYYFFDRNNHLLYTNKIDTVSNYSDALLNSIRKGTELAYSKGEREIIGFHHVEDNKDLVVIASAADRYGLDTLNVLFRTLITTLFVGVVLILIISYFFMKGLFKPLNDLTQRIKKITGHNLHDRLPVPGPKDDLIGELATSFNQMLEGLNLAFEAQKSFVRNASHEMKTPIALVMSQIESTLNKTQSNSESRSLLVSIQEEMDHMGKLINSLLLLNRLAANAETIPLNPLRVDEILFKSIDELMTLNADFKAEVDFSILPPTESSLVIIGNGILLRTCFINLMENSYKYSPGRDVKITLEPKPGLLGISFRNPGNPIAPDQIHLIFEPFFRPEESRETKGYGLGLSIVSEIMKYHKGSAKYEYSEGEHRFELNFPVA